MNRDYKELLHELDKRGFDSTDIFSQAAGAIRQLLVDVGGGDTAIRSLENEVEGYQRSCDQHVAARNAMGELLRRLCVEPAKCIDQIICPRPTADERKGWKMACEVVKVAIESEYPDIAFDQSPDDGLTQLEQEAL